MLNSLITVLQRCWTQRRSSAGRQPIQASTPAFVPEAFMSPEIQNLVCEYCWKTVFSSSALRIAWEAGFLDSSDRGAGYTYQTPPWEQIQRSIDRMCEWCDLLSEELAVQHRHATKIATPPPDTTFHVTVRFLRPTLESPLRLQAIINDDWNPKWMVHTTPDDPASKFIVDRDAIREMDCEITYRLCLDRLQECSQHSQCPHPELTKLPTRVLDCLNPSHPRLFISNGTEMELYAALSYVWGEAQPSKTTMQNLEAYAAGIDINCIPQTICDAITVTRNLNLRYLWVDSFCIIQDSRPDKARELANMRNIFRNAYVTIAAASAKRVTEGFLQKRPVYRTPSTLPFYFPGESPGTMSLVAGTGPPAEAVDERAWCFEERLLSPRSLIFCSHTLRYECQSRAMNVDQTPRYLDGPIKNVRLPDRIFIGTTNNSHAEDKNDKYEWKSVLGKYTKRFLTKPRDRLVALSGIAEQFSLLWPESDYMAGLWRHHLPGSLLWVLRDTGAPLPRPFKYRAPSWSWASVDGEIIQDYATLGILCTVVSCEVTPVDLSNPFGEILSGNLRVRAILKKAVWDRAESELFEVGNNERGVSLSEHDDSDRGEIGWAVADAAEDGMESTSIVTVALVQSTANTVLGLVLAAAESHNGHIQTEIYRRVGRFSAPFCDRDSWLATPYQIIDII